MSGTQKDILCTRCGRKMTRSDSIEYCDLDDRKKTAAYVSWSCRKCELSNMDENGNPKPVPLPPGTIIVGKRSDCPRCGMKLRSTPITDYVGKDGRIWHVPYFYPKCFICGGPQDSKLPRKPTKDEEFLSKLSVPKRIQELWQVDFLNILNSIDKSTGQKIFKFCYSPISREFLFGTKPTDHKGLIRGFGKLTFDEYIRGIYFEKENIIYLRGHEKSLWFVETFFILRRMGVPKSTPIVWGKKAAEQLQEELKGL